MDLSSIVKELESPPVIVEEESNLAAESIEKLASVMKSRGGSLEKFATGVQLIADEFKKIAQKRDLSEQIVSKLLNANSLEIPSIFPKLAELMTKKTDDLRIMNEALNLNKVGNFELGSLSDETDTISDGDYSTPANALMEIMNKVKGE